MTEVYIQIRNMKEGLDVRVGYREDEKSTNEERRTAEHLAFALKRSMAKITGAYEVTRDYTPKGGAE